MIANIFIVDKLSGIILLIIKNRLFDTYFMSENAAN